MPLQDHTGQGHGVSARPSPSRCLSEAISVAVSEIRCGRHRGGRSVQSAAGVCVPDAHAGRCSNNCAGEGAAAARRHAHPRPQGGPCLWLQLQDRAAVRSLPWTASNNDALAIPKPAWSSPMLLVWQSPVVRMPAVLSCPASRWSQQEHCHTKVILCISFVLATAHATEPERRSVCCNAGWRLLGCMGADSLGQPGGLRAAVRNHSALSLPAHRLWPHAAAALADGGRPAGLCLLPQHALRQGKSGWHGKCHVICGGHGPWVCISPILLSCLCTSCTLCPI